MALVPVAAQESAPSAPSGPRESAPSAPGTDSQTTTPLATADTELLPLFDPDTDSAAQTDTGIGTVRPAPMLSVWDFLRMIAVLGGVVGVIYLLFVVLKRGAGGRLLENRLITVLGSRALQGGKALHLVQVGQQIFLVGEGDDAVTLISEVTDRESLDAIRLDAQDASPAARRTFADLIGDLFGANRGGAGSPAPRSAVDFLRGQQDRLRRMGDT